MARVSYGGRAGHRPGESALAALPLLFYLALSVTLMSFDQRDGIGARVRTRIAVVVEPVWWLAGLPARTSRALQENLSLHGSLIDDNRRLRHELETSQARIHRLNAVADENARLRALLGGLRGYQLDVRLVEILDVDLDPYRQRWVLNAGREEGVLPGQVLIDSGGVLGQVIEVGQHRATALLVTDPDHAVPVQVARSGLRAVAYGTGEGNRLVLPNIPQSADLRVGDQLLTSGIGGRFPAGFPVGVITRLEPDNMRLFVIADAMPAAHLDRGSEALLVSNLPPSIEVGPPAPAAKPKPRAVPGVAP
jgi:rod shape-determining protein MreC